VACGEEIAEPDQRLASREDRPVIGRSPAATRISPAGSVL
jgi:hypothetical protein